MHHRRQQLPRSVLAEPSQPWLLSISCRHPRGLAIRNRIARLRAPNPKSAIRNPKFPLPPSCVFGQVRLAFFSFDGNSTLHKERRMNKETFEKGLAIRRQVLGAEFVD